MTRYRIEAEFVSRMSTAWVRFDGPFETRAEAERAMALASKRARHRLRIVEVAG